MIRSMTAFTRIHSKSRKGQWIVEIRSLNHRFFEFSLKIPPGLHSLEGRIREQIQKVISRGKITVNISRDHNGDASKSVKINEEAVRIYLNGVKRLRKRFGIKGDLDVSDLIKLPGIFTTEPLEENPEEVWRDLRVVLKRALEQTLRAKVREGKKLRADIHKRLGYIGRSLHHIEKVTGGRRKQIFDRLSTKVHLLLRDRENDQDRIYREAALLAEKGDITEEIVRLKSHLGLFKKRLASNGEVGKELDFICQEMNREVNTLSAKAQIFGVSAKVVAAKGELEKIREQVQNIE